MYNKESTSVILRSTKKKGAAFYANPQYKKISKTTYRLQGGHGNSGMSSGYGHHDPIQIVKQGNKIKYKYSWSSHVKYSTWFYKM